MLRSLFLSSLLIWAVWGSAGRGQNVAGPSGGDDVRSTALDTFNSRANQITYKSAGSTEWFHGSTRFDDIKDSLQVIRKDAPVEAGKIISLTSGDQSDATARPGDIVLLRHGDLQLHLVYMGEEAFPDAQKGRSFFIYPGRTRLEYNTFPPRKHFQYLSVWQDQWDITLKLFYSFTDPDGKHGDTQWLEPGAFNSATTAGSHFVDGSATYTLFRSSSSPNQGSYVTLRSKLPAHAQLSDTSCFFSAYASAYVYNRRKTQSPPQPQTPDGDLADTNKITSAIIEYEIFPTKPDDDSWRAAAFFREFLVESRARNSNDKPWSEQAVWQNAGDPSLTKALRAGKFFEYWCGLAYGIRSKTLQLSTLPLSDVTGSSLTDTVSSMIAKDIPVLGLVYYCPGAGFTVGDHSQADWEVSISRCAADAQVPGVNMGHYLVITGVRRDGMATRIYFTSDFGTMQDGSRHFAWYADAESFVTWLPTSGEQTFLLLPDSWDPGGDLAKTPAVPTCQQFDAPCLQFISVKEDEYIRFPRSVQ